MEEVSISVKNNEGRGNYLTRIAFTWLGFAILLTSMQFQSRSLVKTVLCEKALIKQAKLVFISVILYIREYLCVATSLLSRQFEGDLWQILKSGSYLLYIPGNETKDPSKAHLSTVALKPEETLSTRALAMGKPILFHDGKCSGFFYVHYFNNIVHRTHT